MKIIVAGTGKVGNLLADQLTRDGHDLVVIDKDFAALEAALEQYDVMSIEGNSASMSVLRAANIEQTDLLIAATGEDETNLLTCLTAKVESGHHNHRPGSLPGIHGKYGYVGGTAGAVPYRQSGIPDRSRNHPIVRPDEYGPRLCAGRTRNRTGF